MSRASESPDAGLLRESGTGTAGSAIALLAGLGLDLGMALVFGAGPDTDALFVALRIPLGVAVFFPPTAIQVLVPAMTAWMHRDKRALDSGTTAIAIATFLTTGLIAAAGMLLAPVLVVIQAPGLSSDGHRLASELARIAFVMIPLVATAQVFRAHRYADRSQGVASALQGVVGLTALGFIVSWGQRIDVHAVVLGYVSGAGLLLGGSWLAARSGGYRFAWGGISSQEMKFLGHRSLPPLGASGIQLGSRLIEQFVASFLAPGSITVLTYANRLVSATSGTLFFRPIVTVFLGRMSHQHARANLEGIRDLVINGLRVLIIVSSALTVFTAVAAPPFVAGLFGLGDLTADQAALLGITVAVYSTSLISAATQRVLLAAPFAQLDTSPYLRNTIYGALANTALLAILVVSWPWQWDLLAVPVAYSMAQWVNVRHADAVVRKRLGSPIWPGKEMFWPLVTVGLAGGMMTAARFGLAQTLIGSNGSLILEGLVTAALGAVLLWLSRDWLAPSQLKDVLRPPGRQSRALPPPPTES